MAVVPVARAIYLCDYHIGLSDGKVDLYGLFNLIRPKVGYPYDRSRFCVFVQLSDGLGEIPFFIDIRNAATNELIHMTEPRTLTFPHRNALVQLAIVIEGCRFPRSGLYLVELFCDNRWVCDTHVRLS
jgi:hypothetical protein